MRNIGVQDRQVRIVLGLSLFIVAYLVVLVVTAFFRFCHLCFGLRISTHTPKVAH